MPHLLWKWKIAQRLLWYVQRGVFFLILIKWTMNDNNQISQHEVHEIVVSVISLQKECCCREIKNILWTWHVTYFSYINICQTTRSMYYTTSTSCKLSPCDQVTEMAFGTFIHVLCHCIFSFTRKWYNTVLYPMAKFKVFTQIWQEDEKMG